MPEETSQSRWAVYFLPDPGTALHSIGHGWLDGHDSEAIALPSMIPRKSWSEVTAGARRYRFHATLKPPFRLAAGCSQDDLTQAVQALAARRSALHCSPLSLARLGGFIALVLSRPCRSLEELAAECVRDLDPLRAQPTAQELAARRKEDLTGRELMHLERWGYPYVLDTWKFHMTLTCALPEEQRQIFYAHLHERCAPVYETPLSVCSISLLEEPGPGLPFRLIERFSLAA